MYATPFSYHRVVSWQEAVAALQEYGDDARLLAGGQSLVPMMNLRLVQASQIIDVNEITTLGIRDAGSVVEFDALVRHSEVESSPVVASHCPMLGVAAGLIGNIRVRHRGTIGGSVAHADPSAELPCALVALRGTIRALGPGGERRIQASDFFLSFFTTVLEPAEVVVGVEVPILKGSTGTAFVEFVRRAGDFATAAVAVVVAIDASGSCSEVRVVVTGIGEHPVDLSQAASAVVGTVMEDEQVAAMARAVADAAEPRGDERASADYRRHLTEVLTRRAFRSARDRARAGSQ